MQCSLQSAIRSAANTKTNNKHIDKYKKDTNANTNVNTNTNKDNKYKADNAPYSLQSAMGSAATAAARRGFPDSESFASSLGGQHFQI